MKLSPKLLIPFTLPALFLPGLASALTVENGTVYGLPENTPFVLRLDNGQTTEVTSDSQGQVVLTDEEDDDDNTLFLLLGSDGDLINKNTGEIVGELNGGELTTAGMGMAGDMMQECKCEWYVGLRASLLDYTDLEANNNNGLSEALDQGFDAFADADDSAWGGALIIGYRFGNSGNWDNVQWSVELAYSQYEEMDALIDATQGPVIAVSAGQSEVSSLGLSFGPKMYLTDKFALAGKLGYAWFETEDSGTFRQFSPDRNQSILLDSFSEEEVDGTGTFEISAYYELTDRVDLVAGYMWALDEHGSSKSDQAQVLTVGVDIGF